MVSSRRPRDDSLLRKLRRRKLCHSEVLGADALVALVPEHGTVPPVVKDWLGKEVEQRWYPVSGGHLVKWPYEGQPPDPEHFRVEAGGWDHEHWGKCEGGKMRRWVGKCEGVRNRFPRMEAMAHPLVAFSAFLGGEV
jgi:hypothetical protein